MYLVSLVSIESSAGEGRRGQNMQQLTWFPQGRAQPDFTPPEETRQTYMRELAALDLKQASQFAAMQAIGTSLVWRGIVLVLVHTILQGSAIGAVGWYGDGIRSLFRVGFVPLPSWAQSRAILEVAAITAGIEAVMHEFVFGAEAFRQPVLSDQDQFMKRIDKDFTEIIDSSGELTFKLALPFSGERVLQHLLVSALLALQVLVTKSLPGAMLTQALGYMLGWQTVRSQHSLGNSERATRN